MDEDQTKREEPGTTETQSGDFGSSEQIGPYRIIQKIGEGGMGEVYLAEQESPIRRKVALKLIKWGMDTKRVVARFESEQQALALMNHPNIAWVFDAGATTQGRPYFAMEYVKGEPIIQYCDKQRLNTRERLELFIQICDGVQHAHQKGIIHRDLKASNVLVMIQDAKPIPKIIDFGVAKATEQRLTERTVFAELGQLIGTPEYMSPEQAEMTVQDIDIRTDVYSLGVLLYELLVGALPFDPKELRKSSFDQIRKRIREEEPSKPSTRINTLGDTSVEAAKRRRTDLSILRKQLRGDLDWITMKALEKDRTRRYQSATEFASDIQRYLSHQPVIASPPSTVYRARKFIRRHRVGVATSTILALMLLAFAIMMTIQAGRIARERDRADREATTAKEISAFMTDLFKVSDPGEARGNTITVREILDKGAQRIDEELSEQPELQAGLMSTIGDVYSNLGLYSAAETLIQKTLEIRKRVLGKDHPDTLTTMNTLAIIYKRQGRYKEAEQLYLETIEARRRVLGKDHQATLATMNNLAVLYTDQGRYEEAEPLLLKIIDGFRLALGKNHRDTLAATNNLAYVYQDQGRYEEAEQLYFETIEIQSQTLGPNHPNTLWSKNNLANIYREKGRYKEAEQLHLETLKARRQVLGEDHPQTILSKNNLASVYERQGRYDEAEQLLLETLEGFKRFERAEGKDHPDTPLSLEALIRIYTAKNEPDKARSHFERLLSIRKKAAQRSGAGPVDKNRYAWLLLTCKWADLQNPQTALRLAIEANDLTNHKVPSYLDTLSLAYHLTGNVEKAIKNQRKAISLLPEGETPLRAELEGRLAEFEAARESRSK